MPNIRIKSGFARLKLSLVALALFASLSACAAEMLGFGGESGEEFVVAGKAVQIRAGELEPQRIPREYWRHRIRMRKAMGLNAISSYLDRPSPIRGLPEPLYGRQWCAATKNAANVW